MNEKTELRLAPHRVMEGEQVIEVWHGGKMIATVTGRDGPGVRVITRHPMIAHQIGGSSLVQVMEIEVKS
jgi:hypothetical protein